MSESHEERVQRFDGLMRKHGPMIYTLSARLMGNAVDGQDLAQQTFVKAFEKLEQFRGDADVGTWFYRICVNEWKNRVRYEKRRFFKFHLPWFSTDAKEDAKAREIAAKDAAVGASLEWMDRQTAVKEALSELNPEDRMIIVLRDMDEKSYEEIGELLDIPVGTVKSRLSRARERIRGRLEPLLRKDL